MNLIEQLNRDIERLENHASLLGIKPESCSTDYKYEELKKLLAIAEWADKAAKELCYDAPLVDWRSGSKRLCEQIEGMDAIGYEWRYWHKMQDSGVAAGERIVTLFDEYRNLTDRSA